MSNINHAENVTTTGSGRRQTSVFDLRIRDDKKDQESKSSAPVSRAANYVTPGTIVTKEMGFMRLTFMRLCVY